jgi:hypothetical protein
MFLFCALIIVVYSYYSLKKHLNLKFENIVYFKKDKNSVQILRKYLALTKNKRLKMHEKNYLSLLTRIPVNIVYNRIRNERSRSKYKKETKKQ